MRSISTHILDITRGRPAQGVPVTLEKKDGDVYAPIHAGSTDGDGRVKELVPEDLTLAEQGGVPVMALISFIGFGASSINAFFDVARNRVILNNGYHRVYALRSIGVTHIPIVLMISHNEAMHLPPIFPGGVPKDYVLNTPRPSLVVDLFRDDLTVELQVKKRIKKVIVQVSNADHDVPV